MYADLLAENPESVPSLSTFYRKKPRNVVKPNRPSDLCKYCFKKPQVEAELTKLRNKATEELKSEEPEALLEANCFGPNDKKRIKY